MLGIKRQLQRFKSVPIFGSYTEALRTCEGYESPELVRVVHEKTKRYRDSVNGQPCPIPTGRRVLDFGGACGAHYFLARHSRPIDRWYVIETPAMAAEARDMEDGTLRFFDSIHEAKTELGKIDLLFTSGALQYVPDPYGTLEQLVDCGAERIFITRLPLADEEIVSVQTSHLRENGPGPLPSGFRDSSIRYPITFMREGKFEAILQSRYTIESVRLEYAKGHWVGRWIDTVEYLAIIR